MAQKKNQRGTQRVRRADRKNIAVGQAHIKSTFNNTIISITDLAVRWHRRLQGLPQVHPVCRPGRG